MSHTHSHFEVRVSEPNNGVVEIEGTISADALEAQRKKVIEKAGAEIEIPGFRKGNAPEAMVEKQLDQNHVLEDAAEEALSEAYPHMLEEHHIIPQSAPRVTLTKLALGNPLEFKISIAVAPEVKLPNYKSIAKKIKSTEKSVTTTDEEMEKVIHELLEMRKTDTEKAPELTDEFVKTLGAFENVEDFKKKLKENLKQEKEQEAEKERFESIIKELVKESKFSLPSLMVDDEVYASLNRLHRELEEHKMTIEDYFAHMGKTEEEFIKAKRESIEEQLKVKFILKEIAKKESITPDAAQVEAELKRAMIHYPNLEPEDFKSYIDEMLTNEQVMRYLEKAEF